MKLRKPRRLRPDMMSWPMSTHLEPSALRYSSSSSSSSSDDGGGGNSSNRRSGGVIEAVKSRRGEIYHDVMAHIVAVVVVVMMLPLLPLLTLSLNPPGQGHYPSGCH